MARRDYCCPWFEKAGRLAMECEGARVEFRRRESLQAWTGAFCCDAKAWARCPMAAERVQKWEGGDR